MMCRRFSRKARGYMLVYNHKAIKDETAGVEKKNVLYAYNEKIHKMYCGHRDANCINSAFIEKVMLHCTSIIIEQ